MSTSQSGSVLRSIAAAGGVAVFLVGGTQEIRAQTAAAPLVTVHVGRNESFLFPDSTLDYVVVISTPRGDSLAGTLDTQHAAVTFRYLADGYADFVPPVTDSRLVLGATRGRALIAGNDCVVCHFEASDVAQAIPTYTNIAERFMGNLDAAPVLALKMISGSQNAWGNIPMPGHPNLPMEDATAIAYYILSFNNAEREEFLPLAGTIKAAVEPVMRAGAFGEYFPGRYVLAATFSDPDAGKAGGSTGYAVKALRSANVLVSTCDESEDMQRVTAGVETMMAPQQRSGHLMFRDLDLSGIRWLTVLAQGSAESWPGGSVEARIDSPRGRRIGSVRVSHQGSDVVVSKSRMELVPTVGRHDLYLVIRGALALGSLCFNCDG
jgi:cytochrome c